MASAINLGLKRRLVLNFHGLGQCKRSFEPGEAPYWVPVALFQEILDWSVDPFREGTLELTLDDGNESDFHVAADALVKHNLKATFFILAGKIGVPGYLNVEMVRALAENGMTIGSHGLDHVPWPEVSANDLQREVVESKDRLEQIIGAPVCHAAVPFGRYDRRVLRRLKASGYTRVYTSDGAPALSELWLQPRVSVTSEMDIASVDTLHRRVGSVGWTLMMQARMTAKRLR